MSRIKQWLNRHNISEDYRILFGDERGMRVLRHMCIQAGITRAALTTDTTALLIKEGRQQFVYSILKTVLGSEDQLARFLVEAIKEQEIKQDAEAPRSAL